jgi:hypothetical protein
MGISRLYLMLIHPICIYERYWIKKESTAQIGEYLGVSDDTVMRYMRVNIIGLRQKGEALIGRKFSEDHIRHMSEVRKGKKLSAEHRKKLRRVEIDESWTVDQYVNHSRDIEDIADELGVSHTVVRNRLTCNGVELRPKGSWMVGERNPMYGKHGPKCPHYGKKRPEHSCLMLSDSNKMRGLTGPKAPGYGRHPTEATRKKLSEAQRGERHPMYGKHHTAAAKEKIGKAQRGEKSHNWLGGISFIVSSKT